MDFRARSVLAAATTCTVLAACGGPPVSGVSLLPATESATPLATPGRIASPEPGPPTFETGQAIELFRDPTNVAVADLDGDGRPDLATDERFTDIHARAANAEACIRELDATFATRTFAEWREVLTSFSGVWAPALLPIEVRDHAQVHANGYLASGANSAGDGYVLPAPPVQFGAPVRPAGPAPELGQHTEDVLLELGRSWDDIADLRASGALG